jgi:hypothetical protein
MIGASDVFEIAGEWTPVQAIPIFSALYWM